MVDDGVGQPFKVWVEVRALWELFNVFMELTFFCRMIVVWKQERAKHKLLKLSCKNTLSEI